jgi:biotin operon repressor
MSERLARKVWGSALDPELKPLASLLALLGHDDGKSIFPSVDYMSWNLGKCRRAIQKELRKLRDQGVLTVVSKGGGRNKSTRYRLMEKNLPERESWNDAAKQRTPVHPFAGETAHFGTRKQRTLEHKTAHSSSPEFKEVEFKEVEESKRDATCGNPQQHETQPHTPRLVPSNHSDQVKDKDRRKPMLPQQQRFAYVDRLANEAVRIRSANPGLDASSLKEDLKCFGLAQKIPFQDDHDMIGDALDLADRRLPDRHRAAPASAPQKSSVQEIAKSKPPVQKIDEVDMSAELKKLVKGFASGSA